MLGKRLKAPNKLEHLLIDDSNEENANIVKKKRPRIGSNQIFEVDVVSQFYHDDNNTTI